MGIFKTPLRYPGGKQKLTPFIKELLSSNSITGHYVEPYAGGAGVAIELLVGKFVDQIHLNDSHLGVYAFWHSLVNENERLSREISRTSLTIDEWKKRRDILKDPSSVDLFDLGFSFFYLNRCNRSGVLTGGVIGGLDQTGNYKMDARYNRNDLMRRIELIGTLKERINLTNMDAERYISDYIPNLPENTLVYLDPPYYNKAKDLYLNSYSKGDHARIATAIQNDIKHNWILSYDGIPEILNLYQDRRHFIYSLQYSASTVYKGNEVFIFCDSVKLPSSCSLEYVNNGLQYLLNAK